MNTAKDAGRAGQETEGISRGVKEDFSFFGIPDESLPPYTNAREFSRRFQRCSVLKMDEVSYAAATGADAAEK